MGYRTIEYTREGHIVALTLKRPEAGNAIDAAMAGEIAEACAAINQDNDVYVVTLTGAGSAFCTGTEDPGETGGCHPAAAIGGIDRPVVAVINGDALGQGLEMALSCDIRIAAAGARLGLPQVSAGRMPADGGTQRLPRIVGRGKALELLLTGDIITAGEAQEIGLVSRVVPPVDLAKEASDLAATIAAKGPIALRYLKEAVLKGLDMTLEQGLRLEADLYFLLHTTADRTEGITAFREKREPEYRGE
jgi:enoyl-CoA hydratase/carnithine racemase